MRLVLRLSLATAGLAVIVVAVLALREATLSTHQPVPPRSEIEVVVSARTRGGEPSQTLAEMTEAQLLGCRLEVNSDLVAPLEEIGERRFRAVLTPSLDKTDQRQLRGCIENWTTDHLLLDVIRLAEIT